MRETDRPVGVTPAGSPPLGPGPADPASPQQMTGVFQRHDMGVTDFWTEATPELQAEQRAWQDDLRNRGRIEFGDRSFVSRLAVVHPDRLALGERTYISGHVHFWGDIQLGDDCTVNPYSEVRGHVRIGDGVRIGAHTSVLGFNHGMSIDSPVFRQPLEFKGISIGDDVWIGAHVVILDGVSVGSHAIIGAGSVVTRDVPEWSVAVGNPARILRDRRVRAPLASPTSASTGVLATVAAAAEQDLPGILSAAWRADLDSFVDRADAEPSIRAWCDAVELSAMFGMALPVEPERVIRTLRGRQDPLTGLVPDWDAPAAPPSSDGHAGVNYHILAVGYALELLGSQFTHPVATIAELDSHELAEALAAQPWHTEAWRAGAWVDSVGTAMLWNARDFALPTQLESLLGWLVMRCDPSTGMWGSRSAASGWLEPVNGFYRLTRGTFAQFDAPLPYPHQSIDSVLDHASDTRFFARHRGTACNVLDVIHPLSLAGRQSAHRRSEGEEWARAQLHRISRSWVPGRGFSFALETGSGWQRTPSLLGTEMWLSITWLLADYLGVSDVLPYRPRGVHRPEPSARRSAL